MSVWSSGRTDGWGGSWVHERSRQLAITMLVAAVWLAHGANKVFGVLAGSGGGRSKRILYWLRRESYNLVSPVAPAIGDGYKYSRQNSLIYNCLHVLTRYQVEIWPCLLLWPRGRQATYFSWQCTLFGAQGPLSVCWRQYSWLTFLSGVVSRLFIISVLSVPPDRGK